MDSNKSKITNERIVTKTNAFFKKKVVVTENLFVKGEKSVLGNTEVKGKLQVDDSLTVAGVPMPTSLNGLSDVTIVKKGGVTEGSTSGASGANEVVLASDSMYIASDSAPVNASTELNQAWGNLAIGKHTLESVTTASRNIAIGNCSLKSLTTGYFEEWNTSGANIAIGEYCLENSVTGFGNIGLGYETLKDNIEGSENTALGYRSLWKSTGNRNTAVGYSSLRYSIESNDNVAVGYNALFNGDSGYIGGPVNGSYNTAVGSKTMLYNSRGNYNTALGYKALYNISQDGEIEDYSKVSANNTIVGSEAGLAIWTGSNNTILGCKSDVLYKDSNNEIVIGYDVMGKGNNTSTIGNTSITDVYMGGGSAMVHCNGITSIAEQSERDDIVQTSGNGFITSPSSYLIYPRVGILKMNNFITTTIEFDITGFSLKNKKSNVSGYPLGVASSKEPAYIYKYDESVNGILFKTTLYQLEDPEGTNDGKDKTLIEKKFTVVAGPNGNQNPINGEAMRNKRATLCKELESYYRGGMVTTLYGEPWLDKLTTKDNITETGTYIYITSNENSLSKKNSTTSYTKGRYLLTLEGIEMTKVLESPQAAV